MKINKNMTNTNLNIFQAVISNMKVSLSISRSFQINLDLKTNIIFIEKGQKNAIEILENDGDDNANNDGNGDSGDVQVPRSVWLLQPDHLLAAACSVQKSWSVINIDINTTIIITPSSLSSLPSSTS